MDFGERNLAAQARHRRQCELPRRFGARRLYHIDQIRCLWRYRTNCSDQAGTACLGSISLGFGFARHFHPGIGDGQIGLAHVRRVGLRGRPYRFGRQFKIFDPPLPRLRWSLHGSYASLPHKINKAEEGRAFPRMAQQGVIPAMERGGMPLLGLLFVRRRNAPRKPRPAFGQLPIGQPDFLVGCLEAASLGRLSFGQAI